MDNVEKIEREAEARVVRVMRDAADQIEADGQRIAELEAIIREITGV